MKGVLGKLFVLCLAIVALAIPGQALAHGGSGSQAESDKGDKGQKAKGGKGDKCSTYSFTYTDGHTDAGTYCDGNDVTSGIHVNSLHVSCSDTFAADGTARKSDLAGHLVASWSITKSDGKTCGSTPPPTDVCPNLAGAQSTIPAGLMKDAAGNCVSPPPVDVCPNIEGHQSTVPSVLVRDANGNCVAPTITVAATPTVQSAPAATPALPSVVTPKATPKVKTKAKKKAKKKAKRKVKRVVRSQRAARLPRVLPFTP